MACVHNAAAIKKIDAEIYKLELDKKALQENMKKCTEIRENHTKFNAKIDCVIKNLEGNTVLAGQTYDNGKMQECFDTAKKTIDDCTNIIKESKKQEAIILTKICSLENDKKKYEGICELCLDDDKIYGYNE